MASRRRMLVWSLTAALAAGAGAVYGQDQPQPTVDPPPAPSTPDPEVPAEPPPPPARPEQTAEQAAATFEQLYGERLKAAQRTRDRADDAALATELMAATELEGLSDALRTKLCRTAFDLSVAAPDGWESAVAAMEKLADLVPGEAAEARLNIANVQLARYQAAVRGTDRLAVSGTAFEAVMDAGAALEADLRFADALALYRRATRVAASLRRDAQLSLRDAMARAGRQAGVMLRLERNIERYKGTQDPVLAASIARTYLIEFDRPDLAEPWAAASNDDALNRNVSRAALDYEQVDQAIAAELGPWYETLADQADDTAEVSMLLRADFFYGRFLELDEQENAQTLATRLARKRVAERLAALGVTTGQLLGGIDLMPIVGKAFPLYMTRSRHWTIDASHRAFRGAMGNEDRYCGDPLVIPLVAGGTYTFRVELVVESNAAVVILPVGRKLAMFTYRAGPETQLGGAPKDDEPYPDPVKEGGVLRGHLGRFELAAGPTPPDAAHTIDFTVKPGADGDQARIEVAIDGDKAMLWEGPTDLFNIAPNRKLPLRTSFGIAPIRNGAIRIQQMHVRGSVRVLDRVDADVPR